jgi:uncharacterized protein
MRTIIALIVTAAACAILVSPAGAASFDCNKAAAPDEIAICASTDLSALDSEMGGLWFAYKQFPFLMGMNGDRMDDAQAFLQTRAACGGGVPCLQAAYRARTTALKADITSAMQQYCTRQ